MSEVKERGNTWDVEIDSDGAFVRSPTSFHSAIRADGSSPFAAEHGRYHLYVSHACPWAHRTLIVRQLKGLQDLISVNVVAPFLPASGWSFDTSAAGASGDDINHFEHLSQVYEKANPSYEGRITVPVLWDKHTSTIVNNESSEIIRMLNSELNALATNPELDLYPLELRPAIDAVNEWVYPSINNGVYRCGFAKKQAAYDQAFAELFAALDRAEAILVQQPWLCAEHITEADVRLFTTLVRFDAVYYSHFKCNLRRIQDYPGLDRFVKRVLAMDGIAGTVHMDHIKDHYYQSHTSINPSGIVPRGPALNFM